MIKYLDPQLQSKLDHFCKRLGCTPLKSNTTQNLRRLDTETLLTLFLEGIEIFQEILSARDSEIKKEAIHRQEKS